MLTPLLKPLDIWPEKFSARTSSRQIARIVEHGRLVSGAVRSLFGGLSRVCPVIVTGVFRVLLWGDVAAGGESHTNHTPAPGPVND